VEAVPFCIFTLQNRALLFMKSNHCNDIPKDKKERKDMYRSADPFWVTLELVAIAVAAAVYYRRSKKWKNYRCTIPEDE